MSRTLASLLVVVVVVLCAVLAVAYVGEHLREKHRYRVTDAPVYVERAQRREADAKAGSGGCERHAMDAAPGAGVSA